MIDKPTKAEMLAWLDDCLAERHNPWLEAIRDHLTAEAQPTGMQSAEDWRKEICAATFIEKQLGHKEIEIWAARIQQNALTASAPEHQPSTRITAEELASALDPLIYHGGVDALHSEQGIDRIQSALDAEYQRGVDNAPCETMMMLDGNSPLAFEKASSEVKLRALIDDYIKLKRSTAPPAGFVMVPEEPTEEMLNVSVKQPMACNGGSTQTIRWHLYRAMLGARPGNAASGKE